MSIVVCLPGGPADEALLAAGERHARQAGVELVLLRHVKLHDLEHAPEVDREMRAAATTREQLQELAAAVEARGVPCQARLLTSSADNPSSELIDEAAQLGAEVLVIGLRTRSRVGKFLLGSTTQDLLLGAGRPVLSVPVS